MKSALSVLFLSALFAFPVNAEENDPGAEAIEADTGSLQGLQSQGKISGAIELRPSIQHNNNYAYTQNTAELGYKFTPNLSLDYTQYFMTHLSDPSGKANDLGLKALDGFLRVKIKNVWQNAAKDLSLGFESRVYAPTNEGLRSAGYIVGMRNYVTVTKTFSPRFSLTFQEIPIVYAYDRPGVYNAADSTKNVANPIFENRIYLIPSFNITEKLAFSFPILLNITRNRDFHPDAANNNRWSYVLWTWPEITYNIFPKTTIGLAFMSENFVKDDFTNFAAFGPTGGISTGSTQIVLRQDL